MKTSIRHTVQKSLLYALMKMARRGINPLYEIEAKTRDYCRAQGRPCLSAEELIRAQLVMRYFRLRLTVEVYSGRNN
jgi:hypothetical protein